MNKPKYFLPILIASFCLLLFVDFFLIKSLAPVKIKQENISLPREGVQLYFSQTQITNHSLTTSLFLDPKGEQAVAADIAISFNPQNLELLEIEPGQIFSEPIVLKKEINQSEGKIRLALASQKATGQSGELAKLTFRLKVVKDSIVIQLIKPECQISAVGESGNILEKITNLNYQPK